MDARDSLVQISRFGNLPKPSGKRCPCCGEQAKAVRSTPEFTYFSYQCDCEIDGYKQSRSHEAIAKLRATRRSFAVSLAG
jgi:hypothetical protein